MGKFTIKQYKKGDIHKMINDEKYCFIDDSCFFSKFKEIIIRDIITYNKIDNVVRYFDNSDGFGYDNEINLNNKNDIIILNNYEQHLINKYYFVLSANDNEKEFLRFIASRYFYLHLKNVLGNNDLTWYNLEHFSHQYIPDVFCKSSVDESLKLLEKNYGDDIRFKRTDIKSNWALILSIISTLLGIIGLFK